MVAVRLCDPKCPHLSLTEEEQEKTGNYDNHVCRRYQRRVYHGWHHPDLVKLEECDL